MKTLRLLPILVLSCISFSLFSQTLLRGPYLQMPTEHSIVVKWRTDVTGVGTVLVGDSPTNLTETFTEASTATDHSVSITGLDTNTTYYYQIGVGGTALAGGDTIHRFKTNPVAGSEVPVRVWAIGDFGKANAKQTAVADAFFNYTGNKEPDVWIWLGDNAYQDGLDSEYQSNVFDIYGNMFSYMPFMPCPGNHDYNSISPAQSTEPPLTHTGAYYDIITVPTQAEAGGLATGHELFYSYDYGNVHFISLNSELGSALNASHDWTGVFSFTPIIGTAFNGSPLTTWLENDLAQNEQPWTIVYFHQPPYSKGSHDSDDIWEVYMQAMREYFTPIFDQYGVDLVVNGHSHVYERSYPIYGHTGDSGDFDTTMRISNYSGYEADGEAYVKLTYGPDANKGTVYAVVGCSASSDSDPDLDHPVMYFAAGADTVTGSMIIDVLGNRLDARFIQSNGDVLDHFTIFKQDSTGPNSAGVVINGIDNDIDVFPNPFSSELTVTYSVLKNADAVITIYDVKGTRVQSVTHPSRTGKNSVLINTKLATLTEGVYFVEVKVGDTVITKKVMKL